MGKYINPPNRIETEGRPLPSIYNATFKYYERQLQKGEGLFALGDRGSFSFCVLIRDEEEFLEFFRQYESGRLLKLNFFAGTEELVKIALAD